MVPVGQSEQFHPAPAWCGADSRPAIVPGADDQMAQTGAFLAEKSGEAPGGEISIEGEGSR
ncbi:hypothetical protein D0T12_04445 [Actinomadura spongiicola]|uniref:Uncharacterized protein n=1 Tax=Actinomadura spongiicola TaxID=2303421 RepID=A0A372GQ34_9ACTN|nr:hypothetical protein D0T12_04445 [Actinomadura spongiicola]